MQPSDASVTDFIEKVTPAKRKRDAQTLLDLMTRVTGEPATLWGTIVGFGQYHYRYESGHEGDAPAAAFAPRKAASTIYLADGVGAHDGLIAKLGTHTTGVSCLYIKDLDTVDMAVLEEIVTSSYAEVTDGTFGQRARDSGQS
jgi:hypothetical protein